MNAQREYNRFLRFLQSRCGMLLSLSIILLCGFLLKIAGLFLEPTLSRDGALYVQLIKIWSEGGKISAQRLVCGAKDGEFVVRATEAFACEPI